MFLFYLIKGISSICNKTLLKKIKNHFDAGACFKGCFLFNGRLFMKATYWGNGGLLWLPIGDDDGYVLRNPQYTAEISFDNLKQVYIRGKGPCYILLRCK